LSNRVVSGLGS